MKKNLYLINKGERAARYVLACSVIQAIWIWKAWMIETIREEENPEYKGYPEPSSVEIFTPWYNLLGVEDES